MKVRNSNEVMNFLLSSERVNIDLDDWLRYAPPRQLVYFVILTMCFRYGEPEQIVLREWEPDLTLRFEFRAFVYEHKLNAISQYDHYGVFPELEALKDEVIPLLPDPPHCGVFLHPV